MSFNSLINQEKTIKEIVNIVWFKRDLRLSDHAPLKNAIENSLPIILVYIFENVLIEDEHYSERHWKFVNDCLTDMISKLQKKNLKLNVLKGNAIDIFKKLTNDFNVQNVYSYQETGIKVTFDRDKEVTQLFKKRSIKWIEYQNNGVIRGLIDRKDWSSKWTQFMSQEIDTPNLEKLKTIDVKSKFDISKEIKDQRVYQKGGETEAIKLLKTFYSNRVISYSKNISKPLLSRYSCSRISPHLAWGSISMRQVWKEYHEIYKSSQYKFPLRAFRSRLFWHCHFIQKFESEDRIEFENANRAFNEIRQDIKPDLVKAWEDGNTGYPLIDACMRCVNETGYLNFRMRAMLVSFLTNNLWQHWKHGVKHLARQFLDFEPGIHYSQFQMQAGTFGTNAFRIYDPVKQSYDHDQNAEFIKEWVPELKDLPNNFALEPWTISEMDKVFYGFDNIKYPDRIIDQKESAKEARKKLFAVMKTELAKSERKRILRKHTKASNR